MPLILMTGESKEERMRRMYAIPLEVAKKDFCAYIAHRMASNNLNKVNINRNGLIL